MDLRIGALLFALSFGPFLPVGANEPARNASPEPAKLQLSNPAGLSIVGDEFVFDFGCLDALDTKQRDKDMEAEDNRNLLVNAPILKGLKHVFSLKNTTQHPVVIGQFATDSMALDAAILRDGKGRSLPYTVQPNATIEVQVAYNYYSASAGKTIAKIDLLTAASKTPVATLVMRGVVDNGINFSRNTIDFGKIKSGAEKSQDIVLKMDRRIARKMLSVPILFETKNTGITISSRPAKQSVMGVAIDKNSILFPQKRRPLPNDLNITYRITISKKTPLGKFSTKAKLWMPELPLLIVFYGKEISIKGEVVK